VVRNDGLLHGVEAVIDKDRASAMLALQLGADALVISTAVSHVEEGFGTPDARPLGEVDAERMRALLAAGEFPAGSMGPKIDAALAYIDGGGGQVVITDPANLVEAVAGRAGTRILAIRDGA